MAQPIFDYTSFELFLVRKGLASATIKKTKDNVRRLLSKNALDSRNSFDLFVSNFLKEGNSRAYYNKYVQAVRHYCDFNKLTWADDIPYFNEEKRVREAFSSKELESFLSLPKSDTMSEETDRFWFVFWNTLAFLGGCRPVEIRNLKFSDVDLSNRWVRITHTKTKVDREEWIIERLLPILTEYMNKHPGYGYLFYHQNPEKSLSDGSYLGDFRRRCKTLELKNKKPYGFRHSYITRNLHEAGNQSAGQLLILQDVVGHSDPKTTKRYLHNNRDAIRKLMEKDPMNQQVLPPMQLVQKLQSQIESYKLQEDERFDYGLIQEAVSLLYKSIKSFSAR